MTANRCRIGLGGAEQDRLLRPAAGTPDRPQFEDTESARSRRARPSPRRRVPWDARDDERQRPGHLVHRRDAMFPQDVGDDRVLRRPMRSARSMTAARPAPSRPEHRAAGRRRPRSEPAETLAIVTARPTTTNTSAARTAIGVTRLGRARSVSGPRSDTRMLSRPATAR